MEKLKRTIEYGLYLLVFLLPLQTRWIIRQGGNEYTTLSLYGTDILLFFLLLLYIISQFPISPPRSDSPRVEAGNFQFPNKSQFPISKRTKITSRLILGLNLISLLSIFFSQDKDMAVQAYLRLTLAMTFAWLIIRADYDRARLAGYFIAGATSQATFALWQFWTQSSFASKWLGLAAHDPAVAGSSVIETLTGERWLRAYGGLDHPNLLGGLLVVSLLLTLWLAVEYVATIRKRALWYGSSLVQLAALFFTFSRSAWAGLLAGLSVMLLVYFWQKNGEQLRQALKYVSIGAILALVLFFTYKDLVLTRLSVDTRLELKSSEERITSYREAFALIRLKPIQGLGLGNYSIALAGLMPGQPAWFYQPVHNAFMLILSEIGAPGLVLYLTIFAFIIFSKSLRQVEPQCIALLASAMVIMLADHYFWSLHFGLLLFWFVVGLTLRPENQEKLLFTAPETSV